MSLLENRKELLMAAGASLLCNVSCATNAPKTESHVRPNIVLITADDLGHQLSCYGDRIIKTPNLDSLFDRGVKFTNAYITTASCSPSRSSILTGLYPHQNGQIGLSHMGFEMHKSYPSIPNELKNAGYRTGIIGKIHVNPEKGFKFDYHSKYHKWKYNTKEVQKVADSAKEFLSSKSKKPFFLYVNYFDPHDPQTAQVDGLPPKVLTAEDMPKSKSAKAYNKDGYDGPQTRFGSKRPAAYYTQVKRLDIGVGRLLKELKKSGKLNNTMIIFISDHGIKGKTTCREAGLRVPLLVAWPGHTKKKYSCDKLVSSIDLMPSILAAAGVKNSNYKGEGKSFLPLLEGKNISWRKYIYCEMTFHTPFILRVVRTVRNDRYKLMKTWFLSHKTEKLVPIKFYDLKKDPLAYKNVAGKPVYAAEVKKLEAELLDWQKRTNDPLLDPQTLPAWIKHYKAAEKEWKAKKLRKKNKKKKK